jgi:hypothetical protein
MTDAAKMILVADDDAADVAQPVLHVVVGVVADTSVNVADGSLVDETPPAGAKIQVVGHQAAQGDIDVSITGAFARYVSDVLDFTTLGLIPGEWIYVGGDASTNRFANEANNGFKRVRSISENELVVDKSELPMVAKGSSVASIFNTARSVLGSRPTTRASNVRLS